MPLQKQSATINFSNGLDTKSDPNQLPMGKFVSLENSIFDKLGQLTKRNGFKALASLPDTTSSYVTTFSGNLTAIGQDLKAYASGLGTWQSKGVLSPLTLSTMPLIRSSTNQSYCDTAISPSGLVCTVFIDSTVVASTNLSINKYSVSDLSTGQNLIPPTQIVSTFGTVSFSPKVFTLGNYFLVFFTSYNGSSYHLQYFSVNSYNPNVVGSVTDFSTSAGPRATTYFDGVVANNSLYVAWGNSSSTTSANSINRLLNKQTEVVIASNSGFITSVTADLTGATPVLWAGMVTSSSTTKFRGDIVAFNQTLNTLFSAQRFVSSADLQADLTNLTLAAQGGVAQGYFEVANAYTYDANVPTDFINKFTCTQAGVVTASASTLIRSLGLGSKAFLVGSSSYFLSSYQSPVQSSYFLINSTGSVVSKLAYQNGGGYLTQGLPSVAISSTTARVSYLIKDLVQSVSKDTNVSSANQSANVYTQTGINLASFDFGTDKMVSVELGKNLNLNSGLTWGYDGSQITEQGFNLYPDSVEISNLLAVGSLSPQTYFYQATYEWTDYQGNLFRSAPSIPVSLVSSGSLSAVIVKVPTLRVTNKTVSQPKVVIYRWSTAQQSYYQVTSITLPITNSTTVDFITFVDRNSDKAILGNNLLYTTGGVLENTPAPPSDALDSFDNRLWAIDAEDKDLLWFSKPVLESTPVEFSDFQTIFVSPNAGAQGPTGPMKCLAPMDDKNIIFKKNAIYYVNGRGPDATGANNQYSEPTFVTGVVGSDNQNSIVMTPNGLMFQSDKGIWLLGRDLSTQYIGKDVEAFNSDKVLSAVTVPGTNQVRFTLQGGTTLMYDYFVGQWGTFSGIDGISSTIYQGLHTYIDSLGRVFQENPGSYLDGANPVLLSFKTGFISLAGLQGYKRLYRMFMLGEYKTPHRLTMGIAQDYDSSILQLASIVPTNYSGTWGSSSTWGSVSTWGGPSAREQWQISFKNQQCQSIQLSLNEYYDGRFGGTPGAGLTLSGISISAGMKSSFPRDIPATNKTS